MKKTRMISVIAASLLTATVVFTGCGGGGSSSTPTSSSSNSSVSTSSSSTSSTPGSSSSSSSAGTCLPGQSCGSGSSSAPIVKTVKVSDGYVLQAIVKCKETNGSDIAQAVATDNPGEYQFANVTNCPVLCAKNGVIDVNDNGQVDIGEPYAPKMTAPGNYANINPYTEVINHGLTPQEVAAAFGLPADTNFDIAIPEASPEVRKNAVLLSAMLAYIERQANVRGIFPGEEDTAPASQASSSTSTSTSSVASGILTLDTLIQAFKSGKTIDDIIVELPEPIRKLKEELDQVTDPNKFDEKAATVLAQLNGAVGSSSSSTAPSSSSNSSSVGIFPGEETTEIVQSSSSSSVEYSSTPVSSSTSSSEASSSSVCEEIPGAGSTCTSSSSSSSEEMPPPPPGESSSSSSSSSQTSSSSSSEEMPPPPPGESSSSSSSSSQTSSSSSSEEMPPPPPGA